MRRTTVARIFAAALRHNAARAGTIGYELLAGLPARVPRQVEA